MKRVIGENIVRYRKLNGMTQQHLAKVINISPQGLFKIEKGLVSPKSDTLEKIMEVLCVTPNQLFGIEEIDEDNISILHRLRREKQKKDKKKDD